MTRAAAWRMRRAAWARHLARSPLLRRSFLVMALAGALVGAGNLPALRLVHYALDHAAAHGDIGLVMLAAAGIVACRLATSAVAVLAVRISAPMARASSAALRGDLMQQLYDRQWRHLAQVDSSRTHSRVVHDTHALELFADTFLHQATPALVPLLVYVGFLFTVDWRLALLVLLLGFLFQLALSFPTVWLKRSTIAFQRAFERFHVATQRALHMLPAARIQGSEPIEAAAHRATADALARDAATMSVHMAMLKQATVLSTTLLMVAVLLAGGVAIGAGQLTLGALAAFLVAANAAQVAFVAATGFVPQLLAADGALLRLAELEQEATLEPAGGGEAPTGVDVAFEAVTLRYGARTVLDAVSFDIETGRITALAAPNGEGKTSLLLLGLGLLAPDDGRVLVGGRDLAELDRAAWRNQVGVLPQHPLFVRGTIRENLLFGRGAVPPAMIERAIHLSVLEPVLDTLPGGLDAPVGDWGSALSGGERQRLGLARALVHAPQLLLLDEPSNHMDADALALVIERLLLAPDRPTIWMATHDARLLAHADRIFALEGGRLTARPRLLVAAGG